MKMSASHGGGGGGGGVAVAAGPSGKLSSSTTLSSSATSASSTTPTTTAAVAGDKGAAVRNGVGGSGVTLAVDAVLPSAVLPYFGADSVKMIAEANGIPNVADDAARALADDLTKKLKAVMADAAKFTRHGRRSLLTFRDIENALKIKNVPPMLGFCDPEQLPFRYASGGGRELFFQEDREIELSDLVNASTLAKVPQEVALKNHWLSIDGIQPAIPDNPPPLSKDRQRLESIDPSQVLRNNGGTFASAAQNRFISQKAKPLVEVVKVKQLATHELSVEQQLYYKEITEACVGSDETRRSEALQSLMYDSGLHQMLPRLCTFISEGVKVNVVQNNLALLIYLMRMVKALLDNHNLYLEKYLHELIPTVITCIVSKQLCLRPEQDNHWALRDFGARLLTQICRNFNTNTNNIQVRVTQLLASALDKDRPVLPSMYGAISCLCEMGLEVQRTFLLRRLRAIGERLRLAEQAANAQDKISVEHIRQLITRSLPATIKQTMRPPLETLEDFKAEFGYLGPMLYNACGSIRLPASASIASASSIPSSYSSSTSSSFAHGVGKATAGGALSHMTPGANPSSAAIAMRRLSDNRLPTSAPAVVTSATSGQIRVTPVDHHRQYNVQQQQDSRLYSTTSSSSSSSLIRPQSYSIATSNSPSVLLGQQQQQQPLSQASQQLPPPAPPSSSTSSSSSSSAAAAFDQHHHHPN